MKLNKIYRQKTILIALAILLLPLLAFALVNWLENKYDRLPVLGPVIRINGKAMPHQVHAFVLTNQEGRLFQSSAWQNKIVIVNFFFTRCGNICPKMTKHLQSVAKAFSADSTIQIVSLTVDPERDTPAALQQYAVAYNMNNQQWALLTGDKKAIYRLARKEFFLTATDGDGGENDFIHSDQLVLLDDHQQIRGYYSGVDDKQVAQLIHDIKKLRHE